jgi:ABC-type multidrug transport system permease subunit
MTSKRSWLVMRGLTRRQAVRSAKSPPLLLPPILFPLMLFAAFAGGLSALALLPTFDYPDYTTFQFVWILLTAMAMAAMATGLSLAQDFESGFAGRILLATAQRWPLVAGYALSGLLRGLVIGALLFAVGLAVGMEVSGSALEILAVIALALLFNIAVTFWGIGVALRMKSVQAAPLLQTPVLIVLFLVPVYTPRNLLSGWVQTAADGNPITPIVEAARGLIIGEPDRVALAFGISGALIAVFAIWAVTGLRGAETLTRPGGSKSRRRGRARQQAAEA